MIHQEATPYQPKHKVRIVTSASLFDGHDAAINIMRRILQRTGAEIIHIGHNRSVDTIVNTAIQEDVQGIAITSYQGGHNEFLKYMYDLLNERGAGHIKIFAGGGGTILPSEIKDLQDYGITRIYSPDDGRKMGLQGMINHLIEACDYPIGNEVLEKVGNLKNDHNAIARLISVAENNAEANKVILKTIEEKADKSTIPILGITGTGGAGKSSLVDEIIRRFLMNFSDLTIGIISVDPSKRKTGGALLGDRIRMNAVNHPNVYMRSLATRQSNLALSKYVQAALNILKAADFDLIIVETSGIGQSDTEIIDHSTVSLYVMTPEYGAASQLEKIDMLDFADFIAVNKFDKRGAEDAVRDVAKQFQRNHLLWDKKLEEMPVIGTIASQFNDEGTTKLYRMMMAKLKEFNPNLDSELEIGSGQSKRQFIIPPRRVRYLSEIADEIRKYKNWAKTQSEMARTLFGISNTIKYLNKQNAPAQTIELLKKSFLDIESEMDNKSRLQLEGWNDLKAQYEADEFTYHVRKRAITVPTFTTSLSQIRIPRVVLPRYRDWGDIMYWLMMENVPGAFPYAAGVFPFKRKGEDPTRMFAGEGGPERTNRRFHYVSSGMPYARLSTAFDSVTLYGEDPNERPDIYGKVGNSGVSICSLDDAKRLYSGFDLCSPKTSVSMTINGPASIMTAFFMNVAIDQECEKYIIENKLKVKVEAAFKKKYDEQNIPRPIYRGDIPKGNNGLGLMLLGLTGDEVLAPKEYAEIKAKAIASVRGTIQADILKEDQAQNTCIFSTEYSLRLMGDMQAYFNNNGIRNFYSVSISGYHIAEAGANPISQLAFTLANGFTYVEYYLSRGMDIDSFAPNLSFFFSNGLDPEYVVIGRVARLIWAKAMKLKYGGNERAQKLKYHIQTSGRSLHAQEISFNDIRTTLQALYAIYDNCNSLHTNAYDEAITTPTEESVRRAMAIQLIINHELGLTKNENPNQGSFIIEELTELVEEAVLTEFDRITDRGGVLGAMETMYQRSKIQEESLYYETLKSTGELPIMGVNTFLSKDGSPTITPSEVIRAHDGEKQGQIEALRLLHKTFAKKAPAALEKLQKLAVQGGNIFEELMETAKVCSLGQMTNAMFSVGGEYRRSM